MSLLSPEAKTRFVLATRNELGLLTPEELAEALGLQVQTLADWRTRKEGPAYTKLGKSVFYRREDVVAWIKSGVVDPASDRAAA